MTRLTKEAPARTLPDRMSESTPGSDARDRLRIVARILPALGLGPYRRSRSQGNVASERAISGPEQEPQKERSAPESTRQR